MGLITRLDDDVNRIQLGDNISPGDMAFVTDRFGNLRLQDPERYIQAKEQSPSVRLYLAEHRSAMEAGPIKLAHHMNRCAEEAFSKFNREYLLDIAFEIWKSHVDP
jgi:hypothetical protein